MQALRESGAAVPADLEALAEAFQVKRKAGTAQAHGSGFGGSGFKFDAAEEQEHKAERKVGRLQRHWLDDGHLFVRIAVILVAMLQQPPPPAPAAASLAAQRP